MKLIAHRANVVPPSVFCEVPEPDTQESQGDTIKTLQRGFDVEVDVWGVAGELYYGHDRPTIRAFPLPKDRTWYHCKNLDALAEMRKTDGFNYFWQGSDDYAFTSLGYFWCNVGVPITGIEDRAVVVMPETLSWNIDRSAYGVCSDHVGMIDNLVYDGKS